MNRTKVRTLLAILAFAGIPLVTTGACDPVRGTFDFYRDDDHGVYDVIVDDGYYYDDYYYYDDPYYYDDCYWCF